ncbi:SRPBCC family protein [Agromyces sp. M3QZ16-3]|uniref:SRPBCC family protein n=1 Tax=Agromyces sp. M3QZ16-3 TaxID=3447585 RepID=UPI003F6949AA
MSTTVTADIEVGVPIRTAYDQWTQFETFPQFMSGVDSIRQVDDATTHWVVSVGGATREFDADISDQVPDDHVAWHSTTAEVDHRGRVEFRPVSADRTRVDVTLEWEPEGLVEKAGAALGLDDRQVEHDLRRFKEFVESRGAETGAWRGELHQDDRETSSAAGLAETPGTDGIVGEDPDLRP